MPETAQTFRVPLSDLKRGTVQALPASALELAPEAVRAASLAYTEAIAALREAHARVAEANAAADDARAIDAAAALASAQQRTTPPEATEPAARAAAAESARMVAPHVHEAKAARRDYLMSVLENRDEFLSATLEAIAGAAGPALEHLDAIEASLLRLRELRQLAHELADPSYMQGASPMFEPDPRHPRKGLTIDTETRARLDAVRAVLTAEQQRGNSFVTGRAA
jgi:hypothetical protein